jgi:hypothetical protein
MQEPIQLMQVFETRTRTINQCSQIDKKLGSSGFVGKLEADALIAYDLMISSLSGLACDDLLEESRSDGILAHEWAAVSGNEQHG